MDNPFFEDWTAPFGAPPLDRITPQHFPPAYDRALEQHDAEIAAIAAAPAGFVGPNSQAEKIKAAEEALRGGAAVKKA